ncbi:glycosyltransferase family 4 protein [Crocosphaera sp. UHCC 0190]|uniref:glycosyltransferase family 4 protein n=1 Tax=Crocosphaera sp. UHCC 0190 TaxID=3110246 RepID=UPI002B20BDE3|nr:glycosyltransferase family 4 protein [Crocosphaera sp. UHCC 0190]MEA5511021.1 glycosyltransferase family 4 protein [Crocosphaera sp. UHCC 0190]
MDKTRVQTLALVPWGNVIEDYLDSINISLETFCTEMTGGWLFGYIEALKCVGIQSILICISVEVTEPIRRLHPPTGAIIYLLPVGNIYRHFRHRMTYAYGSSVKETFGTIPRLHYRFYAILRQLSPYLATPFNQLVHCLKQEKCQGIICQEYEYPRFDTCTLLGKLLKIPVFASFQGGNFQIWQIEGWIRPHTLRHCAGLIVASQTEIERVKKQYHIPDHKIAQIFNPLDLKDWEKGNRDQTRLDLGIGSNSPVVVYHGRIERYRKGLDILLEVWSKISQNYPNCYLLLIGMGNDGQWLREAIAERKLSNIIWIDQFILDRQKMADYLSASDIYCLPSRHEGFPVAPLEAMAVGLPIVATDVPGIADILVRGEASGGRIVPRENSTALGQAIEYLLDNPLLWPKWGQCARQRVKTAFSVEAVGQQLQQFFALSETC